MSWLFTRPEGLDWLVNVRATMLDDPGWCAPFVETMAGEKLPWVATTAPHGCDRFPAADDWAALIEEYQERGAGPRP
jgi:hypothetical protein